MTIMTRVFLLFELEDRLSPIVTSSFRPFGGLGVAETQTRRVYGKRCSEPANLDRPSASVDRDNAKGRYRPLPIVVRRRYRQMTLLICFSLTTHPTIPEVAALESYLTSSNQIIQHPPPPPF
jgi:hypothetical protein